MYGGLGGGTIIPILWRHHQKWAYLQLSILNIPSLSHCKQFKHQVANPSQVNYLPRLCKALMCVVETALHTY